MNGNRSLICPDNLEPQRSASCGSMQLNQSPLYRVDLSRRPAQRLARALSLATLWTSHQPQSFSSSPPAQPLTYTQGL